MRSHAVLVASAISSLWCAIPASSFVHEPIQTLVTAQISSTLLLSHPPPGPPIMNMPEPVHSSASHALYHLISQHRSGGAPRAIPLAGVHDALSARILDRRGAPALFLSGFGVSASLLGLPDAGMTNLVEMEMMARNVCSAVSASKGRGPPIIVDGDTGYGGAPNMLRTVSALADAGAAAITIEDQSFPKRCTIAAGSKIQIVDRADATQRVKCALGARDLYADRSGVGPWIVARTDCRMAYGLKEVIERCLCFQQLGAEIIYAENLQSGEEYRELRDRLDPHTVTMVAQVQETAAVRNALQSCNSDSKPLLTIQEIGELGFDLALFGVTSLQCVVGALDLAASEFLGTNEQAGTGIIGHGEMQDLTSEIPMADFESLKKIVGFEELEQFEAKFPCT